MPAAGTKEIVIDGKAVYLPAEDVEVAEIIEKGVIAQKELERAKAVLQHWKVRLIAIAEKRRNGRSSLRLDAADGAGSATTVWSRETTVDSSAVDALDVPTHVVENLFERETIYRLKRGWDQWVQSPASLLSDKIKARILAVIHVKPRSPSVKFFPHIVTGENASLDEDA
jgi:hypothetical protein